MRITKYTQSCILLEKDSHRLLIDPGTITTAKFPFASFEPIEVVLFTHAHPDHFDESIFAQIVESGGQIFANADVVEQIGGYGAAGVLEDGYEFVSGPYRVKAHNLSHCKMTDGTDGLPNTGFIVDGTFFHPGDGFEADGLSVPNVALPIAGPSIDLDNTVKFADQLRAKRILPMHYDGQYYNDPHDFAKNYSRARVIVLAAGRSIEL